MVNTCVVIGCNFSYSRRIKQSKEGVSIHAFPTQKQTRESWVKAVRRENWQPTAASGVCSQHFHSKDMDCTGQTRRLREGAVPSLFPACPAHSKKSRVAPRKPPKLKSIASEIESNNSNITVVTGSENINLECATQCSTSSEQLNMKSVQLCSAGKKIKILTQKAHERHETKQELIRTFQLAPGGRRRGHSVKCQNADTEELTPDQAGAVRGRKRGHPADSLNEITSSVSSTRKSSRISRRGRRKWALKNSAIEKEHHQKDDIQCYVCNKLVEQGIPLHTRTDTTKVQMYQRLRKVVAGELELVVEEEEVLCPHCTRLLNYMDHIEVELNMLNKAILNCMLKKFGLGPTFEDKTHDPLLVDLEVQQDSPNTVDEMGKLSFNQDCKDEAESVKLKCHWIEDENDISDPINNIKDISEKTNDQDLQQNVGIKTASPAEEFQCRVCMFKTFYKSVIVFHLRQHLKDFYRCDFCNVSLPQHSQRISRPKSCHTEQILESSISKNSEMYETQIQ